MPLPARRRASKVSRAQPPSAQTGTRVSARSGIRRGAMKRERVCADVKGSPSGLSSRNYRGRETFAYYEWRCMRDGDAHDKPAQRIRILDLLLNCSHYAGLHGSVFSLLPVSPRGSATGVERRSGPVVLSSHTFMFRWVRTAWLNARGNLRRGFRECFAEY